MNAKQNLKCILESLFNECDAKMVPASEEQIERFVDESQLRGFSEDVIDELCEFYGITNGIPCLNGFDFHACDDMALFEWYKDQELWLGQRDLYTLRWANGLFCLGDSSNVSFSKEHEYKTLVDLLDGSIKEWGAKP